MAEPLHPFFYIKYGSKLCLLRFPLAFFLAASTETKGESSACYCNKNPQGGELVGKFKFERQAMSTHGQLIKSGL